MKIRDVHSGRGEEQYLLAWSSLLSLLSLIVSNDRIWDRCWSSLFVRLGITVCSLRRLQIQTWKDSNTLLHVFTPFSSAQLRWIGLYCACMDLSLTLTVRWGYGRSTCSRHSYSLTTHEVEWGGCFMSHFATWWEDEIYARLHCWLARSRTIVYRPLHSIYLDYIRTPSFCMGR